MSTKKTKLDRRAILRNLKAAGKTVGSEKPDNSSNLIEYKLDEASLRAAEKYQTCDDAAKEVCRRLGSKTAECRNAIVKCYKDYYGTLKKIKSLKQTHLGKTNTTRRTIGNTMRKGGRRSRHRTRKIRR